MQKHANTVEFDAIQRRLAEHALSDAAKEKAMTLAPFLREAECKARISETTGARTILDCLGTPPVAPMQNIPRTLQLVAKGAMLSPEELSGIAVFLTACNRMVSYLKKAEDIERMVAFYGRSLHTLRPLYEEIDRCIRSDHVDDAASPELRGIRRKIESTKDSIQSKLESMLRTKKDWFSEGFIVTRGDRYALPVKKQYKNQITGAVLDTSSTGQTVFIEPEQARRLCDELSSLQIDEENEVRRILYILTSEVESYQHELSQNIDIMETIDFIFAKGKLSVEMQGIEPTLTTGRRIDIRKGRHPLLAHDVCVPLDFSIGGETQGVIVTGPNTGGKTVALKTVGLLSLMAQSGLHIPAGEGSVFSMNANVLCDIGDGQSISENLSTFSAHMTNIIGILSEVTHESLVLLDELGSGTDPAEGMGLAVAILEELRHRDCLFVVTSHYPEIKEYAAKTPGLQNARMAFDRETLSPLYRLEIGAAGESCALHIARRLGFPEHILAHAHDVAYASMQETMQRSISGGAEIAKNPYKKTASRIQKQAERPTQPLRQDTFRIGDSVRVFPQKEVGIIYQTADDRGQLGVQVKGRKILVPHKRLKLLVPADELYPEDYDFSIIFDTVANRKARHRLDKGNPTGVITYGAAEHDA